MGEALFCLELPGSKINNLKIPQGFFQKQMCPPPSFPCLIFFFWNSPWFGHIFNLVNRRVKVKRLPLLVEKEWSGLDQIKNRK